MLAMRGARRSLLPVQSRASHAHACGRGASHTHACAALPGCGGAHRGHGLGHAGLPRPAARRRRRGRQWSAPANAAHLFVEYRPLLKNQRHTLAAHICLQKKSIGGAAGQRRGCASASHASARAPAASGPRPKVRQHLNPLAKSLQAPAQAPAWHTVFDDPTAPLHVDIGCAFGEFSKRLAAQVSISTRILG